MIIDPSFIPCIKITGLPNPKSDLNNSMQAQTGPNLSSLYLQSNDWKTSLWGRALVINQSENHTTTCLVLSESTKAVLTTFKRHSFKLIITENTI